jgi:hypothetical protein
MPTPRQSRTSRSRVLDFIALAVAAVLVPVAWWTLWVIVKGQHNFNDFHDYWLAAKLITLGRSPYDLDALQALANAEHSSSWSVAATSTRCHSQWRWFRSPRCRSPRPSWSSIPFAIPDSVPLDDRADDASEHEQRDDPGEATEQD